jgi:hypothetical protein
MFCKTKKNISNQIVDGLKYQLIDGFGISRAWFAA